jgi:RecJ-like exonuclease
VKCPKCDGTGIIKLPEPKAPDPLKTLLDRIDANIKAFSKIVSVEQKQDRRTHLICPDCNGFGQIRG